MSQLDQAKKESKRLFNIAQNSNNEIKIENLSKSREILSIIRGYKNWHEYEEVLKRKDFMLNMTDKNTENRNKKEIEKNFKYYIQDISFKKITNPNNNNDKKLIISKEHKEIVLGKKKSDKLFDNKEKKWMLNEYPMLALGSTGAGKTETFLSMLSQYIKNDEGFIYIEGKGDNSLYTKVFSYMLENKKINDLYCLNFLTNYKTLENSSKDEKETISHSIDPINSMVGNKEYFNHFFGDIGKIIHEILIEINKKNELMDISSLESCLMLNNLMNWSKEEKFNTTAIKEYLIEIGLCESDNDEDDLNLALIKHAHNCNKAFETVSLIKSYPHIFRIDCSINMEKVFLERKGLVVLLPTLEKSTYELAILGELIVSQIRHIDEKYNSYKVHFQNIFLDEFPFFTDVLLNMNFKETKNNYIFGTHSSYHKNKIAEYILLNAKTTLIMKSNGDEINNKIKLDLLNLEELPKLKIGNGKSFINSFSMEIRSLIEGQGYVLSQNFKENKINDIINNEAKFYCEHVLCEYIPAKRPNSIWLTEQPRPLIYNVN